MPGKRNSMSTGGGILLFLGSLIYLYAVFTWYGGSFGTWLAAAQFFAPFIAAFAVVSSISLFFMGLGMAAGKMPNDKGGMWMAKFVMVAGMALLIVTGGTSLFWLTVLGFLLTFIGDMVAMM
jgi:hypothetical protein